MKRALSRCSLSVRAALLVVLCSLPASADAVPTTPDPEPLAYVDLWLARTFDSNSHDPARSSQSANPTDEGSLRYLHGSSGVRVGYAFPVLPSLFVGPRLGCGRVMAVQGGPTLDGCDVGVLPTLVQPIYTRDQREFALGFGLPVMLTIPMLVGEAEAGRAVTRSTEAHVGWSIGAELNLIWRWGRSMLLASVLLESRWTPFTVSSELTRDRAVNSSTSYSGQHSQFGLAVGYGWRL